MTFTHPSPAALGDEIPPEGAHEFKFLSRYELGQAAIHQSYLCANRYERGRLGLTEDQRLLLRMINENRRRDGKAPISAIEFEVGMKEAVRDGDEAGRRWDERLHQWHLRRQALAEQERNRGWLTRLRMLIFGG